MLTRYRYGPHKIGKILHQAFCMTLNGQPLETSTISPPQSEPVTPLLSSAPEFPVISPPPTSATQDFATRAPVKEVQIEIREHPAIVPDTPRIAKPKEVTLQEPEIVPQQETPANGDTNGEKEQEEDGLRVLLVEDNEINLKLLVATMRKLKLEYVTAINGLDAFNSYKDCGGNFDVIFMGSCIPPLSNRSFINKIQTSPCQSCPGLNPHGTFAALKRNADCNP